ELGACAELARERVLAVVGAPEDLPAAADGVLVGVDPGLAFELAARYPHASRVFVVHGSDEIHLPPPLPGVVMATVALNDRLAARAAASPGAGEVLRLRQPVDLRRFSAGGAPADPPARVLLLGNYHAGPTERAGLLREAWAGAGLDWRVLGGDTATLSPAQEIAQADIVVGYGRSIVEAMACGRPAYVHDHSGTGGWVTPDSYDALEAGGFAVGSPEAPPDLARIRADLDAYRPELGRLGQDLARVHHDVRDHAAQLVVLLERHRPSGAPDPSAPDPSALGTLAHMSQALLRSEVTSDRHLIESRQWFALYHQLQVELATERGARAAADADLVQARGAQQALTESAREAHRRLADFQRTRRYKLARALGTPLDLLRRGRRLRRGARRRPPPP
ncbi:MAG TPA: hypothetical protein VGY97_03310, partial [Solirubrobacteraceae bacterium]|nr:hypothetical protein [Solirubrobacteraceae bacterium]